ncbi:unnamed protein product, partial [Prorocentrum cordatum]
EEEVARHFSHSPATAPARPGPRHGHGHGLGAPGRADSTPSHLRGSWAAPRGWRLRHRRGCNPQPRKGVYTLPGHMIDLARHGRGVQVSPVLAPPLLRTRARTRRRPGREVERCGRSSAPLLACEPWWLASGGTTCRAQPWSAGAQGLERELRGARQSETALRAMAGVVRKFM